MNFGESPIAAVRAGGDEQGAPLAIAWESSQNSIVQSLLSADEGCGDPGSGNLAKFIANDRDTWKVLDRPWTSTSAQRLSRER